MYAEYDPEPLDRNPVLEQLRSVPDSGQSWVVEEYIFAIDEYLKHSDTHRVTTGDLRQSTYEAVSRYGGTLADLVKAKTILERLTAVRAAG